MAVGEPSDVVVKDLDRLTKAIFTVNPATWQELAYIKTLETSGGHDR